MSVLRTLSKFLLAAAALVAAWVAPGPFLIGYTLGLIGFVVFHIALFHFSKPLFAAVFSIFVEHFDIRKMKLGVNTLYLRRWYLMPRLPWGRRYFLHAIYESDNDRDAHDHPWPFRTRILAGFYIEHVWFPLNDYHGELTDMRLYHLGGREWARQAPAGTVIDVPARHTHKVEIIDGPVWTLFAAGPPEREWGFWVLDNENPANDTWINHEDYLKMPRTTAKK
jgi:hypothetical protein